ncbi:MAG: hypothetical protein CVT92_04045 [Bacteroidetes bacterium HGW-Bacteroidetes-1]|nr:MAG: hypothetical protein CVT92_04045 [Bacteroidetes bacterium HGW-Bacteroidetes-1]
MFLLLLTATTALLSGTSGLKQYWIVLGILAIAFIKFLLIALNYMELSKAHVFWKFLLFFIGGLIIFGMLVMYQSF